MTTSPLRLNEEQTAAVTHRGSPLLIIAGAGAGKTRVITERVAFLLEHVDDLRPENIVALTFTDRATEEMATRIKQRLGEHYPGQVRVHTFHSFALHLVREQSALLQRNQETELLDPIHFWILLRRQIERLHLKVFWKNAEPGRFLKDLIEFISRANDELVSVEDYEEYVRQLEADLTAALQAGRLSAVEAEEQLAKEREIARVYRVASEMLAEAGAQTFGDVISTAVRLLQGHPEVRTHYQNEFRVLLVDEFQDTNVAQIELLDLLAQGHQNITVVGDDDQGIYRFRGASSESFNLFARKFPRFRQLKLTQNYRSTKRILRMAHQLITANPDRFDPRKDLWTANTEGDPVSLIVVPEPDDEALAVAAKIETLRERGRALREMAVLYRAHSHRDRLIKVLRRRGIPFRVVGLSVLDHPSVRDLFSMARFLVKVSDNVACARVLGFPRWELTEEEFVSLSHRTTQHPEGDGSGRPTLYDVVRELARAGSAHPAKEKCLDHSQWLQFERWAESLRGVTAQRPASAALKILAMELPGTASPRQPALGGITTFDEERVEPPVCRVLKFADQWQQKNSEQKLREFFEYFDLYREAGGDISVEEPDAATSDAVRLMTVHAAKGLEFPVVFVLRLTQNYFPTKRRTPLLPFPEALRKEGLLPPGDTHLHEERRLCYVALTRAQEVLTLVTINKPRWKPSEFLADLQRDKKLAAQDLVTTTVEASGEDLENELSLDPSADESTRRTSRLPLWALRNTRPATTTQEKAEVLQLSASSMEMYKTCPMQYKFAHLYRLSGGPSAALTVGSVLHECVRQFFEWKQTKGVFPMETLEEFFNRRWRSVGFEDKYQEERYRADSLEQLRHFYEKNSGLDVVVVAQEKTFEFRLGDFAVIGRIDQMNETAGGDLELIDYKTGRPKDQKQADKSLQLSVYALACRDNFHRPATALAFYNLTTGEKVITDRSAAQLELDRGEILTLAHAIRQHQFLPKKNFFCSQCDFKPICPAFEGI